jgi:hypothetical protein
MGEKGNVTSAEFASAASGVGAVIAGAGTQVTAVFEEAADTIKDKVIDKSADAGIAAASERWRQRGEDDGQEDPATPSAPTS